MSDAMRHAPLENLFGWIQAVVVHPDGVEAALRSKEALEHLDVTPETVGEVLVPSRTLTPIERISIYAGMYPMRMRDALATDYEGLKHFLGCDHEWAEFVDGYIQLHPSRHPNLNKLGKHIPDYIRTLTSRKDRPFMAELAELELAMTQVFDEEESPPLGADELAELPAEKWADAVFVPVRAFRLCSFNYPVNAYLQAVKQEKETPPVRRSQSYVVVYRRNYVVWRLDLTRPQFRILKLLSEGATVATALTKGAKGSDLATLAAELRRWFRDWVEEGLFTRIEVPGE